MLKKIPATKERTIEVCDACGRENKPYYECELCARRVCWGCLVVAMGGCVHKPDLCDRCAERDDACEVVAQYALRFEALRKERALALRELKK